MSKEDPAPALGDFILGGAQIGKWPKELSGGC